MSNAFRFAIILAFGGMFALAERGFAQPPGGPYYRPPSYSPYLNLTRRGNSAAQNYFGLVRPEQAFRQGIQGLQREVQANQMSFLQQSESDNGLPVTGHVAVFMNTGSYFMSNHAGLGQRGTATGATQRVGQAQTQRGATPAPSRGRNR